MPDKIKGPASYFPAIEARYGHPIAYWQDLIRGQTGKTHMQIVGWLKQAHGLGHGHANALVAATRKDGHGDTDPDAGGTPAPAPR